MTMNTAASEALFERGLEVLVDGVSSASRGPAALDAALRRMSQST